MLGKTYVYTYDNAGNRTSKKTYTYTTGSLASLTYIEEKYEYSNTWGDQLTKVGSTAITYDAIGNPKTFNGYTLSWHGRQLKKMTKSGSTIEFLYNADGIRASKTVNNVEHIYTLSGSQIVSESWGSNLLIYLYDESGSPIGMQYRTSSYAAYTFDTFYFEKNLQGDIVAIYNANGVKVLSYTYDAWGNHTTTWHNSSGTNVNATYNPFRYRGYYYDTETGLYYLQSRYYNPQWGRFLNADGLVSTGQGLLGYNMYAYCNNNPIMGYDPTGLYSWDEFWDDVGEFFDSLFGFTTEAGKEEKIGEEHYLFVTHEYGTGYSNSFDTGKPVNFYGSFEGFEEFSAGVDVNIEGYGLAFDIGDSPTLSLHLNAISIDIGSDMENGAFVQIARTDATGVYVYDKIAINRWRLTLTALCFAGGVSLYQVFTTAGTPVPIAP